MLKKGLLLGAFAFLLSACPPQPEDPPAVTTPAWFKELGTLQGVNLPHLGYLTREYLEHPSFTNNLSGMEWNTYRLPITWDQFDTQARVDQGIQRLRELVDRLRPIAQNASPPRRMFLMLDFHQYHFGGVCGGDGVPRGAVDETGLVASDPNCMFLGFGRFWQNNQGVQDGWIAYALPFVREAANLQAANRSWLAVGIEPINEPMAGASSPIVLPQPASWAQTLANVTRYFAVDQSAQIRTALHPFYKKFMAALQAGVPNLQELIEHGAFVLEPFVLDHILMQFQWEGVPVTIAADGDYSVMRDLLRLPNVNRDLFWIGGPHHYDGASDPGMLSFLPPQIRSQIVTYPNFLFNAQSMETRMKMQRDRMLAAGMPSFLGEWGTGSDMTGFRQWIEDSAAAIRKYQSGGVWWRYEHDPSGPAQNRYYLLRAFDDQGNALPPEVQKMKCGAPFDWVERVFGKCVTD